VITDRRRFKDLYEDLLARVDHGGRAVSESEQRELRARLEAWERNPSRAMPGEVFIAERPPSWERIVTRLGLEPIAESGANPGEPGKPRYRPPTGLPRETVMRLDDQLAHRRVAPRDRRYTQDAIAGRLGIDRHVVQDAEELHEAGWPLPRSDPDFGADFGAGGADGDLVRWPPITKAREILASESSGRAAGRKSPL
jgi:hypothetical protein